MSEHRHGTTYVISFMVSAETDLVSFGSNSMSAHIAGQLYFKMEVVLYMGTTIPGTLAGLRSRVYISL